MKTTLLVITIFICISMTTFSQTQTTVRGTLTIHTGNFSSDEGSAVVELFRSEDDIPGKPFMKANSKIKNRKAVIFCADIPYGDYAAILYHDQNSNGTLDHNFFRIPDEPMGFSNEWKLTLFSGMPNFSKLKFEFSEDKQDCKIDIK